MKAFIICYNRLTYTKNLASDLTKAGFEVILIDNNSNYEPLLNWYLNCPYKVVMMTKNYGHQVLWLELSHLITDKYYLVTDHDLDISGLQPDWVDVLMEGLKLFPNVIKSGLSLRIDDLPVNGYSKEVISWEKKFWTDKVNGYYRSDIDTTLAIYDRDRKFGVLPNNRFFSAVRSVEPYTCLHLPWYNTADNLTDEEKYYLEHTGTYWAEKFKELI